MASRTTSVLVLLVVLAGLGAPDDADARPKKTTRARRARIASTIDATTTAAYRYGAIEPEACAAELTTRGVSFEREEEPARGVLAPVRLTAPLRGVTFRTDQSEDARATSRWEVADCRLVLALDDLAQILARHGIVEVRHYSMWRPPSKRWPEDKQGTRHAGAMAIDVGRLIDADGVVLDVEDDFHGRIGARTCGKDARPRKNTPAALRLREILCEAVAARLFNVVLTPNHNRAHRNHFHMEVTAGVRWFMVD